MVNHRNSTSEQNEGDERTPTLLSDIQANPAQEHPARKESKRLTQFWRYVWPWIVADAKKAKLERLKLFVEIPLAMALLYVYTGQLDVMRGTLEEIKGSSKQTDRLIINAQSLANTATKQADSLTKLVTAAWEAYKPTVIWNPSTAIYYRQQNKELWARIRVQNNGGTDAYRVSIAAHLAFRDTDPKKPSEY